MDYNEEKLGQAIRKIRTTLGVTQKELTEEIGISINYLSLLENGKRCVSIKCLNKIAKVLNVPLHMFFVLAEITPVKSRKKGDLLLKEIQNLTMQALNLKACLHKDKFGNRIN